jgi:hypothetical protein
MGLSRASLASHRGVHIAWWRRARSRRGPRGATCPRSSSASTRLGWTTPGDPREHRESREPGAAPAPKRTRYVTSRISGRVSWWCTTATTTTARWECLVAIARWSSGSPGICRSRLPTGSQGHRRRPYRNRRHRHRSSSSRLRQ